MLTIGLTGATGAGKGVLSDIFEKYGIHCLDTDMVSRLVCKPGMPCTLQLAEAFGSDILSPDGELDRKALAKKVFEPKDNAHLLEKLNSITHKHILAYADLWLKNQKADGAKVAVIDAPVLFESGYDKKCDYIIGITADESTRIDRIMKRDSIESGLAKRRAHSQKDNEFLKAHCSVVFSNDSDIKSLEKAVLPYIEALAKGVIPNV